MKVRIGGYIFISAIIFASLLFSSCDHEKNEDLFEGKIEYQVTGLNNLSWKYNRDTVVREDRGKEIIYYSRLGQIYVKDKIVQVFNAEEGRSYEITYFNNKASCFRIERRNECYQRFFKEKGDTSLTGNKCTIWRDQSGEKDTYDRCGVSDSLKISFHNSTSERKCSDSAFQHVVLMHDHRWGWTREMRVATKVTPMLCDSVFLRYNHIIDNNSFIQIMRNSEMKSKVMRILVPVITLIALLIPLLYMRKVRYGIATFVISFIVTVALIYTFNELRIDAVVAAKSGPGLHLLSGLGPAIDFMVRSVATIIIYIVFTILFTVIKKNQIKK